MGGRTVATQEQIDNNEFGSLASDWSLGCDVTIVNEDATIEEIRVNDILLSGIFVKQELSVEIDDATYSNIELGVNVALGGFNVTGVGKIEKVYNILDFGKEFFQDSFSDTFNAHAINSLYKSIKASENDIRVLESDVEILKEIGSSGGSIDEESFSALMNAINKKADRATTLDGYGITDAYTKENVDSLLKKFVLLEALSQTVKGDLELDGNLVVRGNIFSDGQFASATVGTEVGGSGFAYFSDLYDVDVDSRQKDDLISYDGEKWVNIKRSDIKPDLSNYADKDFVTSRGYITSSALEPYIKEDVANKRYATITIVSSVDSRLAIIEKYFSTSEDADNQINKWNEIVDFLNATEKTTLAGILNNYATKNELNTGLNNRYTKEDVNNLFSTWEGTENIKTLGTITSGTWNGEKITNDYISNPKITISNIPVSLGGSISKEDLTSSLGLDTILNSSELMLNWYNNIGQYLKKKEDGTFYLEGDFFTTGQFAALTAGTAEGGVGGVAYLADLYDVTLASLSSGDLLAWNGSKWVNIKPVSIKPDLSEYATKDELDNLSQSKITISGITVGLGGNISKEELSVSLGVEDIINWHNAIGQHFKKRANGEFYLEGDFFTTGQFAAAQAGTVGSGSGVMLLTTWPTDSADYSGYALGGNLGVDLNTRVKTLEGKATSVSFAQTLTSGKEIGAISVDGVTKKLYAPATYAWSEITGTPTIPDAYTKSESNSNFYGWQRGALDVNKLYDGGLYMVASGSNLPFGSAYAEILSLPYRKLTGNSKPDFGAQIALPNGDDSTKPNSMFFRTSLADTWNPWQEVLTTSNLSAALINSALGYTPYNASNPSGFITSSALADYLPLNGGTMKAGKAIRWEAQSGKTPYMGQYATDGSFLIAIEGTSTNNGLVLGGTSGNLLWKGNRVLDAGNYASYVQTAGDGRYLKLADIGSQSVSYASSAGNADTIDNIHFNYENTNDSPLYLWGISTYGTSYVVNRENLHVGSAKTAGTADYANSAHVATNADTVDYIHFNYENKNDAPYYLWGISTYGDSYVVNRENLHVGSAKTAGTADYANSAGSIPWSGVTNRPTKLSDFTDDVVAGKYLSLSGGTIDASRSITFRATSATSGGGGWAIDYIKFANRTDSKVLSHIGAFGIDENIGYVYIGSDAYNGNNLRIYPSGVQFGDNTIIHSGNILNYAVGYNNQISLENDVNVLGYGYADGGWTVSGSAFIVGSDKSYRMAFQGYTDHDLKFNYCIGGTWGTWRKIAFTDSNVASADILAGAFEENINYASGTTSLKLIRITGYGTDNGAPQNYMSGLSVMSGYKGWQMLTDAASGENPYFRSLLDVKGWNPWRQLAFLDDNVASATKLANSRKIWGQSFDGTANVDGELAFYSDAKIQSYSNLPLYINALGNNTLINANYGNVGIGTENPQYKLDVNGAFNSTSGYINGNNIIHSGNIGSYTVNHAAAALNEYEVLDFANQEFATIRGWYNWGNPTETSFAGYTHGIVATSLDSNVYHYLGFASAQANPRVRSFRYGEDSGWKTIALLDDNVASATKLQTARSLWGHSFDGTQDVFGDMSLIVSRIYWLSDINSYSINCENNGVMYYRAYYGHSFYSGQTELMRIAPEGNVIIGATTIAQNGITTNEITIGGIRVYAENGVLKVDGDLYTSGQFASGTVGSVIDYNAIVSALGYTPANHNNLAQVAFSGSYKDLTDKPSGGGGVGNTYFVDDINNGFHKIPNGVNSVVVNKNANLYFDLTSPEDTTKPCIIYFVKAGSYTLTMEDSASNIYSSDGSGSLNGDFAVVGYTGMTLVWDIINLRWMAYLQN